MRPIVIALAAAAMLSGCATTTPSDATFDPAATAFTGWVRVSGEEFQLYAQQRQLAEPFSRPCVSGALPRNAQRAAGDLNGSQVTFTGRAVPWTDKGASEVMVYEGSRITNQCRGAFVIQATDVTVLR